MKRNAFFYLLLSLIIFPLTTIAQTEFIFREGLAIANCHQYGRQAFYTDQFSVRYFESGYNTPKQGGILFKSSDGKDVAWQEIKADSSGRFRGRVASNGYIYLTYVSKKEEGAVIKITGNAMFYFNGEAHAGDPYEQNYMFVPVKLKKGLNEIYARTSSMMSQGITARLIFPRSSVYVSPSDATLPFIVAGQKKDSLTGAVVIINTTSKPLKGLRLRSDLKGKIMTTEVPAILPFSSRKSPFSFNGSSVSDKGSVDCKLTLLSGEKAMDGCSIKIESVSAEQPYCRTFISNIDGSLQYFAVTPRSGDSKVRGALFLSVHGAGVEAIGQARAYKSKDWGDLVAPTNRRPRGFNWEDWGRLDALEVLDIARKEFNPDPSKIFLTGHSMGGHGTWFLGATYPGKWAAIAPCSGYPTLMGYGSADGKIPDQSEIQTGRLILRASNGSNVLELAPNYSAGGVYVLHGDKDNTVPVRYARQMCEVLGKFQADFSYYEYPGGSHWWSNESVDWPPLFEYFKWHAIKPDSLINTIDFTTANPAVSSTFSWATVIQQKEPLAYSRIKFSRDKGNSAINGETENISVLKLDVSDLKGDSIKLNMDSNTLKVKKPADGLLYLSGENNWKPCKAPGSEQKGILRNGTFKEAFNNRMVFVYGTTGTSEENTWSLARAKYDVEMWYYRANGAVDMVADKLFKPEDYPDRGIIIYGNASTNTAWNKMLTECPIQVTRGNVRIGRENFSGDNYGAYLMYPRRDSKIASVAAVTGSGLPGMHAADANQYLTGGSGFPDYLIFSPNMLRNGIDGVVRAGYYTNDWQIK